MTDKLKTAALLVAIAALYGLAGALDNPDSELGRFVDNLTLSNYF